MWRSILAAILFVVTISTGFYMHYYTIDKATEIGNEIPTALEDKTYQELETAEQHYKKSMSVFSTLFIHSSLDEISDSFMRCYKFIELKDNNGYALEASTLKYLLIQLPELDTPNIENIF